MGTMTSSSLYSKYIKERENGGIIEWSHSFATYFITPDECYIRDIYVEPAYRNDHLAARMADEITQVAKSQGCKYLLGSVDPKANKSKESRKVLEAYGMKYLVTKNNLEFFGKEIL